MLFILLFICENNYSYIILFAFRYFLKNKNIIYNFFAINN